MDRHNTEYTIIDVTSNDDILNNEYTENTSTNIGRETELGCFERLNLTNADDIQRIMLMYEYRDLVVYRKYDLRFIYDLDIDEKNR